jgi:hypothetical protein
MIPIEEIRSEAARVNPDYRYMGDKIADAIEILQNAVTDLQNTVERLQNSVPEEIRPVQVETIHFGEPPDLRGRNRQQRRK